MISFLVPRVPLIPTFEVANQTENTITVRWNYNTIPLPLSSYVYCIQCDFAGTSQMIDIQSNQHKCSSLNDGTLYVISMIVSNDVSTIQRSKSINANTCEFKQSLLYMCLITLVFLISSAT
jgi:hypothetical protein